MFVIKNILNIYNEKSTKNSLARKIFRSNYIRKYLDFMCLTQTNDLLCSVILNHKHGVFELFSDFIIMLFIVNSSKERPTTDGSNKEGVIGCGSLRARLITCVRSIAL